MSLFSDLVALFSNANGIRDNYTGISIAEILGFINSEDEIRFYVDGTPNYGHQATTVNILKRIIDATGYTRSVKIIYNGDDTPRKLAVLLPGLIPANIATATIRYGTCYDITFLSYASRGTLEPKRFGFTGGADTLTTNYATELNVAYFLRLQPYLWDNAALRPVASTVERQGVAAVNLNTQSARFSSLAYKFVPAKCASVPPATADWYDTQVFDADLAIRSVNANAVYTAYTGIKDNVNLWPVYGLHQFADLNNEISLNLVISALIAQQRTGKPSIILHFSDPARTRIFDFVDPLALDLAANNPLLPALSLKIQNVFIDPDDLGFYNQVKLPQLITEISGLITPSITSGVELLCLKGFNAGNYLDISELISAAFAGLNPNRMIVISIGGVPQDIYNYFYANSGLPGIFEGQGTSSLVISLGKPFLQIPKPGEGLGDAMNYPSTLSNVNYGAVALAATNVVVAIRDKKIEYYLRRGGAAFAPTGYSAAMTAVTNFIMASITPGQEPYVYFTTLGTYYQKDIHDKLMLGLVAVDALILVTPHLADSGASLLGAKANSLTLADVYAQLNSNWSAGSINLLSALPKTYLSDYFGAVTSNAFSLAVDQQNIVAEKDGSGNLTKVTVSNATTVSFLGITMDITLVFTADTGPVITNVTATVNQQWTLDGVPWMVFENPGFTMTVNEGGVPVQGGIMGTIESGDTTVDLLIEYPVADNEWLISTSFEDNYPGIQTIFQAAGGINLVQSLPSPLNQLTGFGLKSVQLMFNTATTSFDYMAFEMTTTSPWIISQAPLFSIAPTVTVAVYNVADVANRKTTFNVSGEFVIGAGTITVTGGVPDFEIHGGLTDGVIELNDLFALFGGSLNLNTSVTQFNFDFVPGVKYYEIGAMLEPDKPLVIATIFSVDNLSFNVISNNASNSIALGGQITILPDTQKIVVQLSALYSTGNGWLFSGLQTSGIIQVGEILTYYLGGTWAPQDQFNFGISGLSFKIATATSYWEFGAQTAQPWVIDFLELSLQGNALIGYGQKDTTSVAGKYGTISADIEWFGIDFNVFYNFDPTFSAYGIKWGPLEGEIEKKLIGGVEHQIATLAFSESTTVGSLVETFVSWSTGSKFGLSSPWDVLNDIPLNGLQLIYDFTAKSVSFEYPIGPIDLIFATINGIKVSYNNNDPDPNNNGVMVTLDISSSFGDVPPWNAAKPETTPAPPGQGNKYFDLRMLAMGQHVTLPGFKDANTVQDAIACMENMPVPVEGQVPTSLVFDPESSWLIGMDFGVLRITDDSKTTGTSLVLPEANSSDYFLTLQIIFNDPNLYALRIKLDGEPAKVFKGLDFQIMYKKISDTVGVYMAEITLPDAMRQIRMGEFNITLPVFAIQIYTNGDFQVDIGFPWNQNFSHSLSFQTWIITPVGPVPVMGSLGFYFGKLSSATTSKVPQTSTGTFNPVLVFGFGIQFGIGFSFSSGILSAGFSLTAIAILEGVIAKWNPYQLPAAPENNSQVETSYYFWFRGTVGIIGKLYGSIDFAIIKANLDVDIRIIAQITFESFAPILLSLTASVDVSLTITINLGIFKIHISFSFSARISQNVTIAAISGPAPWTGNTLSTDAVPSRRMLSLLAASGMKITEEITPTWSNLVQADKPVAFNGYVGLGLTVAGDTATQLTDQLACYVTMLFIQSVASPQDDKTSCIKRAFENKKIEDTDIAFEKLCKMIFRWAIASIQSSQVTTDQVDLLSVTDDQLKQILDYLTDKNNPIPIPASDVVTFMTQQFKFIVAAEQTAGEDNATYFPVPDDMSFAVPAYGANYPELAYNYGSYNSLSSDYITTLATYFDDLAVILQQQLNPQTTEGVSVTDTNTSMSSFVFSDYFVLICRQMIQAGRESLKDFKYFINPGDTPDAIVTWVRQNGQPAYLAEELFDDNSNVLLNSTAGNKFLIENTSYPIQSGDTFDSISKQANYANGFTAAALATLNSTTKNILQSGIKVVYSSTQATTTMSGQSLTDVAAALGVSITDLISNGSITTLTNLLLPVGTITIPPFKYTVVVNDTLKIIASKFGLTASDLAKTAANGTIADPFDATVISIDIVALGQFNVGKIIQEIQATQGLQHLSGMTSRYYMAGLRLPTSGVTPKYPGMWVSQNGGVLSLPDTAGLYAITGQQFPLPVIAETNFDITFSTTSGWMSFAGTTPAQVIISIVPGQFNALQIMGVTSFATQTRLDVETASLGIGGTFNSDFTTYPFTSEIKWNSACSISMPYGGIASGVPALKLWQLPDTILKLSDPSRTVALRVQILIGQYNGATGSMVNSSVNNYGYATNLEFNIKKIPAVSNSPSTLTTYEISGADGTNADLLEKIVAGIGSNDGLIAELMLAFSVSPNGSTLQGIQTDDPQFLTLGIAQVNLSTETHSGQADYNLLVEQETVSGLRLLNKPTEFINLLWEASITRAGGFYLYYYNSESAEGLPDSIFNDKNEATLHLVVIYSAPSDPLSQNTLNACMNTLVTAQSIDSTTSVLFAQANPNPVSIPASSAQTLAQLAYNYYENVSDVAIDNQTLPLTPGITIAVNEGVFEVGPPGSTPGGDINAIAKFFGTTVNAIKLANPNRTDWTNPLPLFTSIFLPSLNTVVGTSGGGNTFASISTYYRQNLSSLANFNQDVPGIFESGNSIKIAGGPKTRSSTVPAGVAAMEAIRPVPAPIPDDPTNPEFGKLFLQNTYSLLCYQLVENEFFKNSKVGLPAGPTTTADSSGNDKIRAPKTAAADDNWIYRQSIPYSRFSKQNLSATLGLPYPADSPYRGLGDLLKVDFNWQDYYGNRIITTLSSPVANDGGTVLNQPPALTGYTDALIGISQWPSISSSWLVDLSTLTQVAEINLQLNFDNSSYQGLCGVIAQSATVIIASFTLLLDPVSSVVHANYLIQQQESLGSHAYRTLVISSIVLNSDLKSVTITVDHVDVNEQQITMNIGNILSDTTKPLTFSGVAKFLYPDDLAKTLTPVTDSASRSLSVYKQLWYQLTDANGIQLSVNTSLLQGINILSSAQVTDLVQNWIATVYCFVADRANAGLTVPVPAPLYTLAFPINFAKVNSSQIFKLDMAFSIERTGGAIAGDFETTGGIKQVSTSIPAYASPTAGSTTYTFDVFAANFEKVMVIPGTASYYAASGVDRTVSNNSSGGKKIWAVRVELDKISGIWYQVNNPGAPIVFAPRPISNVLESRNKVPIYDFFADLKPGINFNKASRYLDFSGIDMDGWGRIFFAAIDHILSPEFIAGIQIIDEYGSSAYYADIIKNKSALANIVKYWMIPAFYGVDVDVSVVQELFKQTLLVQLSNAYNTNAAIQFDAAVQAEKPIGISPRLLGTININFGCLGAVINVDDNTQVNLFFNSEPNQAVAEVPASYHISEGLIVKSATLDPSDSGKVILQLNGNAGVKVTQVSIIEPVFTDILGNAITPPLNFTVQAQIDAGNYTNAISITSAKLDLAPNPAAPLSFLISSPQVVRDVAGSVVPCVNLNLNYAGSTIEHQVEQLFQDNPYLASSWLSFLTKAGNAALATDLGKFQVPMFLRNFPSPPSMISQSGAASTAQTGSINFSTLLNWDYTIYYSEPFHFPQDILSFTVNFNVMVNDDNGLFGIEDAFAELAEFITVFPAVNQAFIDSVATIDAATDPSKFGPAIIAISSFNEMVDRIVVAATSTKFAMPSKRSLRASNAALPYNFNLVEGKATINSVEALLITIDGDLPDGIGAITVKLDDCSTVNYPDPKVASYSFYFTYMDKGIEKIVLAVDGQQKPNRTIVLQEMNILARQDAETLVELKRNVELVSGSRSADPFIYATGQVGFPNKCYPTITNDHPIEISAINALAGQNTTTTLQLQLTSLFAALLKENSQPILFFQMSCSYNYEIGVGMSSIVLPVMMQPLVGVQVLISNATQSDVEVETLEQMIENWAGAIKSWYQNYQPNLNNAALGFDLTVFSNLTENPMTLIKLSDLTLEIQYITDLNEK